MIEDVAAAPMAPLRDCPADMRQALAEHASAITWARREGPRVYLRAQRLNRPGEELFGWYTHSYEEPDMVARERAIREHVGTDGVLRAPPLLAYGENWRLEPFLRSEPIEGEQAIALAIAAALEISRLELPPAPPAAVEPRMAALRRRALVVGSPLPTRDYLRARRLIDRSPLPAVTSHGEFHSKHLFLIDGAMWLIDWDRTAIRPAGYDLMHLWVCLEHERDRDFLFRSAMEVVGPQYEKELAELRYALLAQMIASCFSERYAINREPALGRRLLQLLPATRAAAR